MSFLHEDAYFPLASIRRYHDLGSVVRLFEPQPVFLREPHANEANVAVVDDDFNGFQLLALAGPDEAMSRVEIELRLMMSAGEEIRFFVEKMPYLRV
jgi:hypothetical protein